MTENLQTIEGGRWVFVLRVEAKTALEPKDPFIEPVDNTPRPKPLVDEASRAGID